MPRPLRKLSLTFLDFFGATFIILIIYPSIHLFSVLQPTGSQKNLESVSGDSEHMGRVRPGQDASLSQDRLTHSQV